MIRLVGGPHDGLEVKPAFGVPPTERVLVLVPGADVGGAPVAAVYLRDERTGRYNYSAHTVVDGTEGPGMLV